MGFYLTFLATEFVSFALAVAEGHWLKEYGMSPYAGQYPLLIFIVHVAHLQEICHRNH